MKKFILSMIVLFVGSNVMLAQENKTLESESTTKKVIVREGSKVIVKKTQETVSKEGEVMVEGGEKQDQQFQEKTVKVAKDQQQVGDQELIDQENEARKAAILKKQQEELERSKMEMKERAEAKKREMEEKKAAQMKAMEERRAELMKRGKGVNKLKKKKKDNG